MIGDIYKKTDKVSLYQPSKEIRDFTGRVVKKDYETGDEILNKSWVELNDMSVLQRKDRDQRTFNAFVDENVEDPAEAWKWRGTRSKARNKAIALHANITAGYVLPMFMAQNEASEEDRVFSDMMRDISEWMVNNSEYKSSFLMAAMGMLVNPVTYMGAEYAEVYQTIKEKTLDGYTKQEIIDETLSGFKAPVYSAEQVLITNAFQQNIQKQRCIIKRRYIEYSEAEAIYGPHEDFKFVQPGVNSVFSETDGLFYDLKDDEHETLVEEAIYLNRREDTEVAYIGGIYMGDTDDVEANPIAHRDNRNAPKYNVVPFGYQRINEHFYFYKSLMNAQFWDNQLIDAQYEMGMNRIFLDINMPVAITGQDEFDSDIIFPGSMTAFKDKDTRVTPVIPQADISKIFNGISVVEKSMDESSQSDLASGQIPGGDPKATTVAIANANAKTMLQGVGKTLAESMVMFGGLMADIIINHLSIPVIDQLSSDSSKLKYRTFILPKKSVSGKEVTKIIKFDDSLLGMPMTEEQKKNKEAKMLEAIGYPNNTSHVYNLNPELFARYKYLTYIEPQTMFPKNEEFVQAMMKDLYTLLRKDPLVSSEALVRELVHSFFRGKTDDMMAKQNAGGIMGTANPLETSRADQGQPNAQIVKPEVGATVGVQ